MTSGNSQTLSTSAVVRNEILYTNIRTGRTRAVRPETDESAVSMLRCSYYQLGHILVLVIHVQLVFGDCVRRPADGNMGLDSVSTVASHERTVSDYCGHGLVGQTSSGAHGQRQRTVERDDHSRRCQVSCTFAYFQFVCSSNPQTIYRENLVVLDNENHLYHVVVKGG